MLLNPKEFSSLIRQSRLFLFGGLVLIVFGLVFAQFGLFTGCMAVLLGSCITTFDDWQFDIGRWKQTSLFFLIGGLGYFALLYARIQGLIHPVNKAEVLITIDIAIATALAWTHLRFLLTITRLNWLITKTHQVNSQPAALPWLYKVAGQRRSHEFPRTV